MAQSPGVWPAVFFTALGLGFLALRVLSERPGRARDTLRSTYLTESYLWPRRMIVVTSPVLGFASLVIGLSTLLPRYYGAWLFSIGFSILFVGFVLSFRPPRQLVPKWFHDELEAGTLPPLRMDLFDRVQFASLVIAAIVLPVACVMLIVVYEAAGSPP